MPLMVGNNAIDAWTTPKGSTFSPPIQTHIHPNPQRVPPWAHLLFIFKKIRQLRALPPCSFGKKGYICGVLPKQTEDEMKERLLAFAKTYVLLVLLFAVQKPLFMLFYIEMYGGCAPAEWGRVVLHGLPLDLSVAGYLSALPALLLVASAWAWGRWLTWAMRVWFGVVSLLMSVIFILDLVLYEYWGFRLDTTPFFYFFSSPGDTLASASGGTAVLGFLMMAVCAVLLFALFHFCILRGVERFRRPANRVVAGVVMFLLAGVLFIPIRGGFTVSTMNTGKAYFSSNQRLNHAAINPAFSLLESAFKESDFASQYRFLQADDADMLFRGMRDPQVQNPKDPVQPKDSLHTLLRTQRPDVLLIILESFSSHLMGTLGGDSTVAPCLDSIARSGVLFTRMHANSFRTDRGLVSILSGYPAQPSTSIMKYPRKSQSLPSIAGSLRKAGYRTRYYYGGDADFTNMRSYLMSSGFEDIVCDRDFPVSDRLSKWGVHDHLVFRRLLDDLRADTVQAGRAPRYRVLQTSSSHEPFEVPYRRLANDRMNAFAYTDSCVGDFVRRLRQLPQWENTLLVFVPDHQGAWPEGLNNFAAERYEIPLILAGGAVRRPRTVDTIGSQQDIAATLLAQLGLPHADFTFSKDLLDPRSPHFAFITFPGMLGLVSEENRIFYDINAEEPVTMLGPNPEKALVLAMAYLQKLYDDIASR